MTDLEETARYFPPRKSQPIVAPGLFRLGTAFGNGDTDAHLFQFDTQFPRYRENKLFCRGERFSKYVCYADFDAALAQATVRLMVTRLSIEHPTLFACEDGAEGGNIMHCRLTGDCLRFDSAMRLISRSDGETSYVDAFDALCCQIQEDVAVVEQRADGSEAVCALHLCAPSHWAAEDKIGRSFAATHAPVPHFEKIAAAATPLQSSIQERGPFVRFAWGIEWDDRLNHHPEPSPIENRSVSGDAPFYLRVERQGLWGLPLVEKTAYLFMIRVYTYPVTELSGEQCAELTVALRTMSPDTLRYKGLADRVEEILSYLATRS